METDEKQNIPIFREKLPMEAVKQIALDTYGEMAKAVVDIERRVIAVGGYVHADAEAVLIDDGSKQSDIWGINIFPTNPKDERIAYTSLINIRPSMNNRSQDIQDPIVREKIRSLVDEMVRRNEDQ